MLSCDCRGELTSEEKAADDEILEELKAVKQAAAQLIARQRKSWPSTYKSIHTVLAFRVLVEEYRHRLKEAYKLGCISQKMQHAVESQLELRIVRRQNTLGLLVRLVAAASVIWVGGTLREPFRPSRLCGLGADRLTLVLCDLQFFSGRIK